MKTATRYTPHPLRLSDAQTVLRRNGYYTAAAEINQLREAYGVAVRELDAKPSQAAKAAEEGRPRPSPWAACMRV